MPELRFHRPIENDETPDVETLTISEEGGRVRICMDSEGLMFTGTYTLSADEEAKLLSFLADRLG